MRLLKAAFIAALFAVAVTAEAASGKIIKVLPHFLDTKGRHTTAPSLFERDAYQKELRDKPALRGGLRWDVQWKASGSEKTALRLRIELRTSKELSAKPMVIEKAVREGSWFSTWSAVTVSGKEYEALGEVIAWRATLWEGDTQLAEQKSFLW